MNHLPHRYWLSAFVLIALLLPGIQAAQPAWAQATDESASTAQPAQMQAVNKSAANAQSAHTQATDESGATAQPFAPQPGDESQNPQSVKPGETAKGPQMLHEAEMSHTAMSPQKKHETEKGHKEVADDPPRDPAWAVPYARSPGRKVMRGPYVSVQVNVDLFGQNIVGDAANEPSIAVDPTDPDKIVIGWRQFDSISSNFRQAGRAYSHDGGQSFTFPGVFTPGTFRSDPVLDFNSQGDFYYYSLEGDFTCDMFISTDGGVNWQGPIPAWGDDKNWMGIDRTGGIGDGNVYCTWTAFSSNKNFTRSTDGGQTYMNPIPCLAQWNTIAVDPGGRVYVCSWDGSNLYNVQRSSNAQNPAVTPTFDLATKANLNGSVQFSTGPNPGGLLGQVWIAANPSTGPHGGEIYLLASVNPSGPDPLDVYIARSTDQGQTWSAPVRVNDDSSGAWQWFGTMSVAPNGRIDVIFNDTRNSGLVNISELYYTYSRDGGQTWSKNVAVTPPFDSYVGWPQQNKLGDYYDMVSHDDGAHVAYSATFNGEQDVYYVKLYPDAALDVDTYALSARYGGIVNFYLNAGTDNASRLYFLLGSVTGTEPGLPLPGGMVTLPLNWDAFTDTVIKMANSPNMPNFKGTLDGQGMATAQLNTLGALPPTAVGLMMDYAYLLYYVPTYFPYDFVSNPVTVEIVP